MNVRSLKSVRARFHKEQSGITGLETAIVLIAFVVVAAVFAFTVLTTGLFTSEKAKETALAGVATTSSSLTIKGAIIAGQVTAGGPPPVPAQAGRVDYIRAKIATATGVEQVLFNPNDVLITYTDENNVQLLTYNAQAITDQASIDACVGVAAVAGSGVWCMRNDGNNNPIIDPGEVMELIITLDDLGTTMPPALGANSQFVIEIIPQDGAVLRFERRTPLDITPVMNLD